MKKMFIAVVLLTLLVGCKKESGNEKKEPEVAVNAEQNKYAAKKKVIDNTYKDMVLVPKGEFVMGTNDFDEEGVSLEFGLIKPFYIDEQPEHKVYLDAYYIDKYEITYKKYKEFLDSSGYEPPKNWKERNFQKGLELYPVGSINWFAAKNYCSWNQKHLPKEAEWEKAARGTDGRKYPWGNKFDQLKSNSLGLIEETPKPVGSYENGISPYGVYDMVGNVLEWVDDWYKSYPGSDYRGDDFGEKFRVLRGASYGQSGHFWGVEDIDKLLFTIATHTATTTYRIFFPPSRAFPDAGFRCAKKVD